MYSRILKIILLRSLSKILGKSYSLSTRDLLETYFDICLTSTWESKSVKLRLIIPRDAIVTFEALIANEAVCR